MPQDTDETVDLSSKQNTHLEEIVKDQSSSSTSSSSFPSMFWGGNIAEKVKLSRRKASMKVVNDKTNSVKQVKTIVAKKPSLNVIPEKVNHEGAGGEKKRPMRIKFKMNPVKRARLMSEVSSMSRKEKENLKSSRKRRQEKLVTSRGHVSESSSSSSSSSDSDSDESSSSSESDSDNSSSSSSSSGSSSSSHSSSDDSSSSSSGNSSSDSSHNSEIRNERRRMKMSNSPESKPRPKLKVRGKTKQRNSNMAQKAETREMECLAETCPNPPCERALTEAEIRNILGDEEGMACASSDWVRRSTRQPSRSAVTAPNVRALVGKLEMNDPDMVVLKCKKYLPSSDTPTVIVDTMLDALEKNTNCQALYIQNFNNGMRDDQVLHLLRILQSPSCNIWCLNIGETYNVKRRTWAQFTIGLKKTKITHMYASEHTISSAMKEKIRDIIRDNRKKHNMHIDPNNLDVIVQCTHCWWNPINAQALQPYIKQRGYEYILNDKVAQGTKDAGNIQPK